MKKSTLLASFLLALGFLVGGASTAAAQTKYDVDPAHTSVLFRTKHLDIGYVYGMFLEKDGEFAFDADNPQNSKFSFVVKADSVFTGNKKRDDHLKSPDFLNAKQFPEIKFESTKVEKVTGSTYRITGNLTLHGETKQIETLAEMTGKGKGPQGNERIGFFTSFDINRQDYGVSAMPEVVSDRIHMIITTEGVAKE